jgi:hypothetical protein
VIKRYLWYLLLLFPAAPVLLGLGAFIYPRYSEYSDLTISHLPNAIFILNTLRTDGFIPLWSNLFMGGYPFSADPLAGLWYPPNWIGILVPAPYGFNLAAGLHLFWAGLGMTLFLTRRGLSRPAAVFGGIAFAGMPKLFAHLALGHISLIYSLAWYPWLLLAEERRKSPGSSRLDHLLPGCVLGIIALADIRSLGYASLLYVLYWGWRNRMIEGREYGAGNIAAQIARLAGQIVFALGIAAAQLLPLIQFSALSTRANLTAEEALIYSLPFTKLLNLFIPEFGGYAEWITYPGAAIVFLLFLILATPGLRRRTAFWIGLFAAALILSLGANLPFLRWSGSLPGASLLRVPPRLVFLSELAAAVAASQAFDEMLHGYKKPKFDPIFWMVGAAAFFLVLLVGGAVIKAPVGANQVWGCAGMAITILLIGLAERGKLPAAAVSVAFPALLVIDLVGVNLQSIQYRSSETVYAEGKDVVEFLKEDEEIFRVYSPSYALPQLASARAGIEMASAIHPLQLVKYADRLYTAGGVEKQGYSVTLPPLDDEKIEQSNRGSQIDAKLLGEMNVKYIAAHYPIEDAALTQVWQSGEIRVYENSLWRPRAWLENNLLPNDAQPGKVEVSKIEPGRVVLKAEGPGRLVWTEVFYPGWQASIDGQSVEILCVNDLWMGLDMPDGVHQVEFRYQPGLQLAGIALSIACWAMALVLGLFRGRR